MNLYSANEIRLIVASRSEIDDTIGVVLDVDTDKAFLEMKLIFRFWPQYKTYVAFPVTIEPGYCALVAIEMPDAWYRYLKREIRRSFGVRHLHNVNLRDNSKRIEKLLGLKYVH